MAAKFKPGDTVQLKVGGPIMVVDAVGPSGGYYCTWFAGKKHERAHFNEPTLKAADPED